MMDIRFSKWLPDYAPKTDGLLVCSNLIPYNGKLYPLRQARAYSSDPVLGDPLFVAAVVSEAGSSISLIGTTTGVYQLEADVSLTDVSIEGGYETGEGNTWDWTVYGTAIFLTCYGEKIQSTDDFTSLTAFEELAGSPPKAKTLTMWKDHLWLGWTNESGTEYPRRLFRSKKGDPETWTVSAATGCGYYDLPAFDQRMIALRPQGDYLLAYMSGSIWAVTEIGSPIWYGYQQTHHGPGPYSLHSVVTLDRNRHVYIGEDDVYGVAQGQAEGIGDGIRQSVCQNIDQDNAHRITHQVDYSKKIVQWAYPVVGGDGTPTRRLIYNWGEGRFSSADIETPAIGTFIPAAKTIDELIDFGTTIDGMLDFVIDSKFFKGGSRMLGFVDANGYLAVQDASAMDSVVETGEVDLDQAGTVTSIRPMVEQPAGSVNAYAYARLTDRDGFTSQSRAMNTTSGLASMRLTGRMFRFGLQVSGLHSGITGLKFDVAPRGKR